MITSADLRRNAAAASTSKSQMSPARIAIKKAAAAAAAASAVAATLAASAARTRAGETTTTIAAKHLVRYRHDPYSYRPITEAASNLSVQDFVEMCEAAAHNTKRRDAACLRAVSITDTTSSDAQSTPASSSSAAAASSAVPMTSAGFALPLPASKRRAVVAAAAATGRATSPSPVNTAKISALDTSVTEDGVSEASSENGHSQAAGTCSAHLDGRRGSSSVATPVQDEALVPPADAAATAHFAALEPLRLPPVIRYASVNFRFGSAWFIAPFKTFVGDIVVVQYPVNNSLHMGIVSAITTTKPATFYSAENPDPHKLTEDEIALLPRFVRHARDFDKDTKLDLRTHDLRSLQSAQQLADDMAAPIQFLDAEWLLDLSAITFLVNVYGDDMELLDRLADELASIEGAEVVFTYPAVASAAQQYA